MRSRSLILPLIVVVVAVALVAGVAVAGAGQSAPLPDVSASELLAQMAQADDVAAVSGEIAWHNGLFGDLSAASDAAGLSAQSPLLSSGSGRIWASDAGLKLESQGSGGDQVVVVDKDERTAWVYSGAQGTVAKLMVTGSAPAETASPAPSATALTPEAISLCLQRLARVATVEVAGQTKVAGRDTYQLRFTPTADDTALGYVQADVDGETMLPLQLEVYAKGGTTPVLKFGFTSVSYDAIDASRFAFTPPEGATVTTKTIDTDQVRADLEESLGTRDGKRLTEAQRKKMAKLLEKALLTRREVAALVPYELASARGYEARPFQWGVVLGQGGALTKSGTPLLQALGEVAGMDLTALTSTPRSAREDATQARPASVLLYGQGLGAIALAQTKTTSELREQLKQAEKASQILGSTTVGDAKALEIGTPLGGIIVWQRDGTTLLAGGMVPMSDLQTFAESVR